MSGKLVIPEWAGPTGSRSSAGLSGEPVSPQRASSAPAGPYGYQPEFFNKQTAGLKHRNAGVSRRSSSAALLLTAASGVASGLEVDGPTAISRAAFPISQQASSTMLMPGGSLVKQPSVLGGGRTRRPSQLGLPSMHVPSLLHALPENDAYLGPAKPRSPRRTSSFLTSSGPVTRKGSAEFEAPADASMPVVNLTAESDVMDASLMEPEIVDQSTSLPLDLSRRSTSGSYEIGAASSSAASAVPLVQVSCNRITLLHSGSAHLSWHCLKLALTDRPTSQANMQLPASI